MTVDAIHSKHFSSMNGTAVSLALLATSLACSCQPKPAGASADVAATPPASATAPSSIPALTAARVLEDQGHDNRVLTFVFATGPDNPQLSCKELGEPQDDPAQTKTAIAIGWLDRRCENNHIQLRLTAEGRRLSSSWGRSGDSPGQPRQPEDEEKWTNWFVEVADFTRTDPIEILPGDLAACGFCTRDGVKALKKVIIHGHWEANDAGRLLKKAHWTPIAADRLEQTFVFKDGMWLRIEHLSF